MVRAACITLAVLLAATLPAAAQSTNADQVWAREKTYWQYVKAFDVAGYRSLWHADFLGWPYFSPEPVRKDHITDWLGTYKDSGQTLRSYELEQRVIQVTENMVTTTYRIHQHWVDKGGAEHPVVTRIIHTWVREPAGEWVIISGMSAPTDGEGH